MNNSLLVDFWKRIGDKPEYMDIIEDACKHVASVGITIPNYGNVGNEPQVPKDITKVPNIDLGRVLDEQTQWGCYLATQLAIAEGTLNTLNHEVIFRQANIRLENREDDSGKKTTVQQRDDHVATDIRYIVYNREALKFDFICKLLKAADQAVQRNIFSISRQITQRGQDFDNQTRTFGVGNMQHLSKGIMGTK